VVVASPWLARLCVTDPSALDILADLDGSGFGDDLGSDPYERVRRLKDLGVLRAAARDLLGLDTLDEVGHRLSALAELLLTEAVMATSAPSAGMAVVALGKLGAAELNYASDIDLILVAPDVAPARQHGPARMVLSTRSRSSTWPAWRGGSTSTSAPKGGRAPSSGRWIHTVRTGRDGRRPGSSRLS